MDAKLWLVKQVIRSELKAGGSPDSVVKKVYELIRKACADEFPLQDDALLDNFLSGVFFDTQSTDPEVPEEWLKSLVLDETVPSNVRLAVKALMVHFKLHEG